MPLWLQWVLVLIGATLFCIGFGAIHNMVVGGS